MKTTNILIFCRTFSSRDERTNLDRVFNPGDGSICGGIVLLLRGIDRYRGDPKASGALLTIDRCFHPH
jgi:hypothetical protein